MFYYVADGNDRLYSININTLTITNIGSTGVSNIEAIAYWPLPGANRLFAANGGTFGEIDTNSGSFTSIGEIDGGGTANGALGPQTLNDVDGLAFDGQTGQLWGSERKSSSGAFDLIFKIDTATGLFIPNAFGLGIDYIVIDGTGLFEDVDDIAFDPIGGLIYGNTNVGGNNDLLIQINKFTGVVDGIASLSNNDVEGLSFHNGGQMYGSEGSGNQISRINKVNGVMNVLNSLSGGDPEALAALVADASTVVGRVYNDVNRNGVDNSEAGIAGVRMNLYLDVDSNSVLGANDILIQTAVTDASGDYHFYFATLGYLIVNVDLSTAPVGYGPTTVNLDSAIFLDTITFGEINSNNDFGLATGTDTDGDGIPDFYEGVGDSDGDGIANYLDLDSDDDGILDEATRVIDTDADGVPNYLDLDSDNDGISDAIEGNGGIEPNGYNPSTGRISGSDTDSDGLKNTVDNAPGVAYGAGSTSPYPLPDTDHDGITDQLDLDSDNDGILDIVEGGGTDLDFDGRVDGYTDSGNDGFHDPAQTTPYDIVNADSTYEATNSMELKPNYRDNDSDNDGIDDTREGQPTNNYRTRIFDQDYDSDGIIDYWDIGLGGLPIDPIDFDGDGMDDYTDLDTDDDGVIDFIEGNDLDMNGVADVALSNTDADSNGIDDSFDGNCTLTELSVTSTSHAEQKGSSVDISSSDLELTRESSEQIVGLYWSKISVGPGASVSNAYIQFETDESGYTGDVNLRLRAELSTNASTFTTSSNNVTNRTLSSDSVDWAITAQWTPVGSAGAAQRTPDISNLLKAVAAQPGWTINSPFVVVIERSDGGSNRRVAENDPILYYTPGDSIFAAHGCASDVALQNTDGDAQPDWRDVDDDDDGRLTSIEDINGNSDWSDDFTQGGNPVPDYLTYTPCPGGTLPEIDSLFGASISQNNGVVNPNNALNISDDSYAQFYDAGDTLVVQMPVSMMAGRDYTIFFKHRNYSSGLTGGATVRILESPDNVTYTANPITPSTFSVINTDSATLTAQVNARFLKIYLAGTEPDFDFDAIRYVRSLCQGDNDGDLIGDNIDIDDDNDGIPDSLEYTGGLNPTEDADNDGILNYEDADFCTINAQGVCTAMDFDGDGVIDQFDLDADNDGILDLYESGIAYATLASLDADSNGIIDNSIALGTNGLANALETSADNGTINYTVADTDGDGENDALDLDSDNDGITDLAENGNGLDANENGIIDGSTDSDNDGVLDSGDSDNVNLGSPGTFPRDTDGDGVPNYLDIDSDNDGITDIRENVDGTGIDANNDGVVDGSTDTDGDGILDSADSDDSNQGSPNSAPTDTDSDGNANPYDIDADNDGIVDLIEAQPTTATPTVPSGTDTDGDGLDNNFETTGLSPIDTDLDTTPDYLDTDSDDDGESDVIEGWDTNGDGTAETVPSGSDSDGDGLDDNFDDYDQSTANEVLNPTNNGQDALDFPNADEGGTQRDWREVPCANGDVVLSALNTTTVASGYCVEGGWTYYYNPADSTELLFAIEHMPVGGNTNDFTASISLTVSVDPDTEAGVFSNTDVGNEEAAFVMGRYWNVNITSGSLNGNVNVRFFYDTDDADTLEAVAQRWNDQNAGSTAFVSGRMWFGMNSGTFDHSSADLQPTGVQSSTELFPSGTSTIDGTTYAQFNGLSSLTGGGMAFVIGNNSVILPIELISFHAIPDINQVELVWITANEINSDNFIIERSDDLHHWSVIGSEPAAGYTDHEITYSHFDFAPLSGTSYYRLLAMDRDGSIDVSNHVRVDYSGQLNGSSVFVYPNPSDGSFQISFADNEWTGEIELWNTAGQIVYSWLRSTLDTEVPQVEGLASGVYMLKIIDQKESITLPIIIR